jgi:hypothetical protein
MAYDQIEPFGDLRANWHSAMIAHIIAKANTSKKHRPPQLKEFMWKSSEERQMENLAEADQFFFNRKGNGRSR